MYRAHKPSSLSFYWAYGALFFVFLGNFFVVALTIIIAYNLSVLPATLWSLPLFYTYELRLPAPFNALNQVDWLGVLWMLKPQWSLLMVMYWAVARPRLMGIVMAWLVGLGLDILQEGLIGEYALVFSIVCYFTLKMRWRLLHLQVLQQMILVLGLLLVGQFLVFWIQKVIGHPPLYSGYWLGSVGGMLMWPLLVALLPRPNN